LALSTVVKNFLDGTITAKDGTTPTALERVLAFDRGDFSISGLSPKLNEVAAYERRGKLQSVRHTTRRYWTISGTMFFTQWSDTAAGSFFDLVFGTSGTPYAARVSTLDNSDVDTLQYTFDIEGSDFNDDQDHQLILNDVHLVFSVAEGDPTVVSFEGTGYGTVAGDLAAAEVS